MNRLRLGIRRRAARHVIERALEGAAAGLPDGSPFKNAVSAPEPAPTFTRRPAAETRPIAGLAPVDVVAASRAVRRGVRPYVSAGAPKTLLFDELTCELPLPAALSAGEVARLLGAPSAQAEAPGSEVMLYSGDGWTGALCVNRVRTGEWDDWAADVERGMGRNAAEAATAARHARQGVADGWRRFCLAVGEPGWIDPGLRRIRELVIADRNGTGPQRAAGGAA